MKEHKREKPNLMERQISNERGNREIRFVRLRTAQSRLRSKE